MRKPQIAIVLLLVVALLAVGLWLDPTHVGIGYLTGETFFEGRPVSYWHDALIADPATSSKAMQRLSQPKPQAVDVLVKLLHERDSAAEVRWNAIKMLSEMGAAAESAQPALLETLEDSDPHVAGVAAAALPKIGVPAEKAVPALSQLLGGPHTVVAARALSEYKGAALPALETLVQVLEDETMDVEARWNAARTLGKLGPAGAAAVPVLTEHLQDSQATVREHAAEALGDIGPPAEESVEELVAVLDDPAVRVRRDAVRSLGQIGGSARGATAEIEQLLQDPEAIVREAAANTLKSLAPAEQEESAP